MTTLFEILGGISLSLAFVFLYLTARNFYESRRYSVDAESIRFANNTTSNHARISGITSSGKITHHKHSCGGASFKEKEINKNSLDDNTTFIFEPIKHTSSYVYVPQTRLHGGGWFA